MEYLKWLLYQPNVQLILGNHEMMLLSCSFLFDEITDSSIGALTTEQLALFDTWSKNGCKATVKALKKEDAETRADILEYLREAPLYEEVNVRGTDYVLTHSGLGDFSEDKLLEDYTANELAFVRPEMDTEYSKKFTTIFGHTPTYKYGAEHKGKMICTDTWINIDTGAAGGLAPMLLRLDDMTPFYLPPMK